MEFLSKLNRLKLGSNKEKRLTETGELPPGEKIFYNSDKSRRYVLNIFGVEDPKMMSIYLNTRHGKGWYCLMHAQEYKYKRDGEKKYFVEVHALSDDRSIAHGYTYAESSGGKKEFNGLSYGGGFDNEEINKLRSDGMLMEGELPEEIDVRRTVKKLIENFHNGDFSAPRLVDREELIGGVQLFDSG